MYDYIIHEILFHYFFGSSRVMISTISLPQSSRLDLGFFLDWILVLFVLVVDFFCFLCYEPYSGIRAVSMRTFVARVEHNGFVGVDVFIVASLSCTLHLAGWWDEAAWANFTCLGI